MPITATQNAAIKEVIQVLLTQNAPRGRRQLAAMFMDLVDRQEWPQYFEVSILSAVGWSSELTLFSR